MTKRRPKSWFRLKGYTHLTAKISGSDKSKISSYVNDSEAIAKHAFYPLIHNSLVQPRYKEVAVDEKGEVIRAHQFIDETGKLVTTRKVRHIYYATHLDAQIYSFYANVRLGQLYEKYLKSKNDLSNCICAYRRIPAQGTRRNKSNIHFAKDVFDYIKVQEDCVVLTFDIKGFFDNLDHSYLKKSWCKLLEVSILPKDHYNLFKSLTHFSFVELKDLLKVYSIAHRNELRRKNIEQFGNNPEDFRKLIRKSGYIKKNPNRNVNGEVVGIPQGTALSALLANVYMLEFDEKVYHEVCEIRQGLYKRYSDDIIVVCSMSDADQIKNIILETIKKYSLEIQREKTGCWHFSKSTGRQISSNKPLSYLGFEYDGKHILIKSSSISKFYREMSRSIKIRYNRSIVAVRRGSKETTLFRSKLYKRFSYLGKNRDKRNFLTYVEEASIIMNEPKIKKQLSKAWDNLNIRIEQKNRKVQIYATIKKAKKRSTKRDSCEDKRG